MNKIDCQICFKKFKSNNQLSSHIRLKHNIKIPDYFKKYLIKEKEENLCLECKKETEFLSISEGFRKFCSSICSNNNNDKIKKQQKTCEKNNGSKWPMQNKNILEKSNKTNYEKYGVKRPAQNKNILKKMEKSCIKKFGTYNVFKSDYFFSLQVKKGIYTPKDGVNKFKKYYREVINETEKHKKLLFKKWNGTCFYTGQKLVTNEEFKKCNPNKMLQTNKMAPTIDHKISISWGYINKIDPKKIGNIDNLCVCSRWYNCHFKKNYTNEQLSQKILKLKSLNPDQT